MMMLGIHGRPVDVEFSVYALADRLKKTPDEIRAMTYIDMVHMGALYEATGAVEKMNAEHQAKRQAWA